MVKLKVLSHQIISAWKWYGVYESGFWDFAKVEILYENGVNFEKFRVIFHKIRFFLKE